MTFTDAQPYVRLNSRVKFEYPQLDFMQRAGDTLDDLTTIHFRSDSQNQLKIALSALNFVAGSLEELLSAEVSTKPHFELNAHAPASFRPLHLPPFLNKVVGGEIPKCWPVESTPQLHLPGHFQSY